MINTRPTRSRASEGRSMQFVSRCELHHGPSFSPSVILIGSYRPGCYRRRRRRRRSLIKIFNLNLLRKKILGRNQPVWCVDLLLLLEFIFEPLKASRIHFQRRYAIECSAEREFFFFFLRCWGPMIFKSNYLLLSVKTFFDVDVGYVNHFENTSNAFHSPHSRLQKIQPPPSWDL